MITAAGYNAGLFAFPIFEKIWGKEGLKLLSMFDIGNAVFLLGVNIVVAAVYGSAAAPTTARATIRTGILNLLKSPPFVAYLLAIVANVAGLQFPEFLSSAVDSVARANMALVLLLVGIYLEFRLERSHVWALLTILATRVALAIVLGGVLYVVLPFDQFFRGMIVVMLLLPVGTSNVPYAVEYGLDARFAGTALNLSIVLSFFLIWAAVALLGLA